MNSSDSGEISHLANPLSLVRVSSSTSSVIAATMRNLLSEHGIPSWVECERVAGRPDGLAIGLMVRNRDAELAWQLVRPLED